MLVLLENGIMNDYIKIKGVSERQGVINLVVTTAV